MKLEIEKIIVDERQRKDIGHIEELMVSFVKWGQLHPVIVTEDFHLVAGFRRLTAAKQIGWTTIEAKTKSTLTQFERAELELEENIQRKQLTWSEEVTAKKLMHELKTLQEGESRSGRGNPGWGIRDTATMLDESVGVISQDIALAKAIESYPALANEPSKTSAFRKLKVMEETLVLNELARRSSAAANPDKTVQLVNESCITGVAGLADESVDLVITDPPWAVDINSMAAAWHDGWEVKDTFDDKNVSSVQQFGTWKGRFTLPIVNEVLPGLVRVLKNGSHFYMFCAYESFADYADTLTNLGMVVRSRPLIWVKNIPTMTAFFWKFMGRHEIILFAHKGEAGRILNSPANDVLVYNTPEKRIHPTEKPLDLLRFLMETSCSKGDLVLDPFAGSAATLRAARLCERRGIGYEIDEKMCQLANGLLYV